MSKKHEAAAAAKAAIEGAVTAVPQGAFANTFGQAQQAAAPDLHPTFEETLVTVHEVGGELYAINSVGEDIQMTSGLRAPPPLQPRPVELRKAVFNNELEINHLFRNWYAVGTEGVTRITHDGTFVRIWLGGEKAWIASDKDFRFGIEA
jgi:hypothetical protein